VKDQLLSLADEICNLDFQDCIVSSVLPRYLPEIPRPLMIGVTVANTGRSFVVMGGSAVCFSFGTFWNKG
jgi:tRNA wybutosine-synthesizing protein 4